MKKDEKTPPESMLDAPSAAAEAKLSVRGGRAEVRFMPPVWRVRLHGHTFSASEKPAVIVDGKKRHVLDIV